VSKNRRNSKGMTGKAHHKLMKRVRIAMAVHTQNAWIEDALGVATDNRPERHRLFAQARAILGKENAAR
jgi:hypothetical protein